MGRTNLRIVAAGIFVLLACSGGSPDSRRPRAPQEERKAEVRHTRASLDVIDDVVPVGRGAAYAVGIPTGLWYIRGTEAVRVRVIGDSSVQRRYAHAVMLTVQPTGDGGAYAFGVTDGVWRVDGDSVRAVSLTNRMTRSVSDSLPLGDLGLAMAAHERNKQRRETPPDDTNEERP